jgi:hypothetical protein
VRYCFSNKYMELYGLPSGDVPFSTIRMVFPSGLSVTRCVPTSLPSFVNVSRTVFALSFTDEVLPSVGSPSKYLTGPPLRGCVKCSVVTFPLVSVAFEITSLVSVLSVTVTVSSLGAVGLEAKWDLATFSFHVPVNELSAYKTPANAKVENKTSSLRIRSLLIEPDWEIARPAGQLLYDGTIRWLPIRVNTRHLSLSLPKSSHLAISPSHDEHSAISSRRKLPRTPCPPPTCCPSSESLFRP